MEHLTKRQRYMVAYRKELTKRRRLTGLCITCGIHPPEGNAVCRSCHEKCAARRSRKAKDGLCRCGRPPRQVGVKTCVSCYNNAIQYDRRVRNAVLQAYGNRCACCGETMRQCLEVDHMDGNGGAIRKTGAHKWRMLYQWLLENNFPPGFQLLCSSCNKAKRNGAECPHETMKREMIGKLAIVGLA